MNTTQMRIINRILNKIVLLDIQVPQHLKKLSGQSLEIRLNTQHFEKIFFVVFHHHCIQCVDSLSEPASVIISGPLEAFVRLALTKNVHAAAHLGLSFSGDSRTIEDLQSLFLSLDIEWEEYASQFMGDSVAHQMGNWVRQISLQKNQILNSTARSVSEYLTEEIKTSPTHYEVNTFMNAVDCIRADTERLELKIARLQTHRTDP